MECGDTDAMQSEITRMLYNTISYYDYSESYYHGFLTGLLYGIGGGYAAKSNREGGSGRTDLFLKPPEWGMKAYIFEFKRALSEEELEKKAGEALRQITDKKYDIELRSEGFKDIAKYGIAFFGKECFVVT